MHFSTATALSLLLVTASPIEAALSRAEVASALERVHPASRTLTADGRISEVHGLEVTLPAGEAVASARILLDSASHQLFAGEPGRLDIRLVEVRESLRGTHVRFRQYASGLEVEQSDVIVTIDQKGSRATIHNRSVLPGRQRLLPRESVSPEGLLHAAAPETRGMSVLETRLAGLNHEGELRFVRKFVVQTAPLEPVAFYVDLETGKLLSRIPLFFSVGEARIFETNPVESLNDPSLQDLDDSAAAVRSAAYTIVTLPGIPTAGPLSGPNVSIRNLESPATTPVNTAQSMLFDRSNPGFEEVMAYYHLDKSQRYLQSLGFTGSRQVIQGQIEVDAHAAGGADNSYYVSGSRPGDGSLYFGDGGVDDAEDPDILLHEYGHAIQDAIAPGAFNGSSSSQARAAGEGFGDYWGFSAGYATSVATGRDPFCVGDWDARCGGGPSTGCGYPRGADCLRRVDGQKTMGNYIFTDQRGSEHRNGEIWSSALREIFLGFVARRGTEAGSRLADQVIIESHFGLPPIPQFRTIARQMIEADRSINNGAHEGLICAAMTLRQIFTAIDCQTASRGNYTVLQSPARKLPIPDNNPAGVISATVVNDDRRIEQLLVRVDITHPFRGDLRILLTAPDGRLLVLQPSNNDTGTDLHVTYGLDTEPRDSLDVFRGASARGEWKLQVIDTRGNDAGELISWALIIQFAGESPVTVRPTGGEQQKFIPVVAKAPGAAGTSFTTDVRVFNGGQADARVTAIFTASGADGLVEFSPIRLVIPAGQTAAFDDVVGSLFRTSGTGTVELRGDTDQLVVTSRTYNLSIDRTFGQFIPAITSSDATGREGEPLDIVQLQNSTSYRTNIGLTELAGAAGIARVKLFNGANREIDSREISIRPLSHFQYTILGGPGGTAERAVRAEVVVVSGLARIAAYGSVVDNESGDPIFIPARKRGTAFATRQVIPAVLHADGGGGARWRSDLWLTNPTATDDVVTIRFRPSTGSGEVASSVPVAAGASLLIDDVLGASFGVVSAGGQLELESSGRVIATSRTFTPGFRGTYGQFIPARPVSESIGLGERATATQLESSSGFRTNVGISEINGAEVLVRIRLHNAAGTVILTIDRTLPPYGQVQLNVASAGAPPFSAGRVSFEVVAGGGRVFGYASVIDNLSGDPIYVPAR